MNAKAYTSSEALASLYSVDDERKTPTYLNETELAHHEQYVIRSAYAKPGKDGLYQTELANGSYLADKRSWTTRQGVDPSYPPEMWGVFNPIWRIICTDVSSLMNEFQPEGITVRDSTTLTEKLRGMFEDNGFGSFFQLLFTKTASLHDAYVRVRADDSKRNRIALHCYPGDVVYPVLSHDELTEQAFRIYYRSKVLDELPTRRGLYVERDIEYYQVLNADGQMTEVDGTQQGESTYSWNYNGMIPMVHFPWLRYEGYYGMNPTELIMEDIDRINLAYTAMWLECKRLMFPMFKGKDCSADVLKKSGMSSTFVELHGEQDLSVLSIPFETSYLEIIKSSIENVHDKLPHYTLFRAMASMSAQSAESHETRYGGFLAYEKQLETVQIERISKLCNTMLRVAGLITEDVQIDVEMGPAISKGIEKQLDEVNAEIKTFGENTVTMDRAMKKAGYTEEEKEEIRTQQQEKKAKSSSPYLQAARERAAKYNDESNKSEITKSQIATLRQQGLTFAEIAAQLGVSTSMLSAIMKRA